MKTFKEFLTENVSKYKIGFTWESPEGTNKIVSYEQNGTKYGVVFANSSPNAINFEDDSSIDLLIRRDASNIEFRKKEAEKNKLKQAEIGRARNLYGFLDSYSKLQRGKIEAALLDKQAGYSGKFWRNRRDAIHYMINIEKRTINYSKTGRRLETPEGYFYDEKDLTKLGMDYAEYLINNKIDTRDR